jgi:death-on-curing family protein
MTDVRPIIYLTVAEVERFNQEILQRAGQPSALLRERGLLESAVQRPQTAAYYASADLVTQAALYMVGIARNHPFVDGNKRTGYISGMTFLHLNGYVTVDARLNDAELGVWLEQVVSRQLTFEVFVERLRQRLAVTNHHEG